jgi:hypothetical protein
MSSFQAGDVIVSEIVSDYRRIALARVLRVVVPSHQYIVMPLWYKAKEPTTWYQNARGIGDDLSLVRWWSSRLGRAYSKRAQS